MGYTHLRIPAVAESRTTISFPQSRRVVTREAGDLLWPAREGEAEIAQRKTELGAYGFACQYQQSPSPRSGGMFKRDWWSFYDELPTTLDEYLERSPRVAPEVRDAVQVEHDAALRDLEQSR